MNAHFQRYGRTYLIGCIFIVVQLALAVVGEFGQITPAQEAAMTKLQWFCSGCSVIATAGTTILAYLNPTATNAQNTPATQQPPPLP